MPKKTQVSEERMSRAIEAYYTRNNPKIKPLAREFEVSYHVLIGRIRGRKSQTANQQSNKALNPIQEKALISWIDSLNKAYTHPYPELIERTANCILKRSGSDRVVGHNWVYRFIERLPPHFHYSTQKPMEKKRMESENFDGLSIWFDHYTKLLEKYEFRPNEIFNWDETGYIPGQGKPQKVVSYYRNPNSPNGGQAELITGIECVAADGWSMIPWFLVKGSGHQEDWFTSIDIEDFRIRPTQNGYIDDSVALEWLVSFNEASKIRIQKGRPRLLLMDNHGCHCTFEFMDFCHTNFIIPCYFHPHTTHLIQPLDGQVFQAVKHWFRKANNEEVMWGGSAYQKRDFFRIISDVRRRSFTQRTIRSSFESRGIYPIDSEKVLKPILAKLNQQDIDLRGFETPSPSPELTSSVTNSPPNTVSRVNKLNSKLITDVKSMKTMSKNLQKHIQRSMDANLLLSQRLELAEADLKKALSHKARADAPKTRRTVLGLSRKPLGPAISRKNRDSRVQADSQKHARALVRQEQAEIAEQLAQTMRDQEEDAYQESLMPSMYGPRPINMDHRDILVVED